MNVLAATAWWVSFAQPWWLLALAAALGPGAMAWRAKRRGRPTSPLRTALQMLAIAAVALALAQPAAPLGGAANRPILILRDVSASTGGQSDRELPFPPGLPQQRVDFAAALGDDVAERDATNLAPALRLATARAEQLGGVVIRTDGQFTDADWPAAARSLGESKLPVWIVPLESPPVDGRIESIFADRHDDEVRLRVTVASTGMQTRRLRLTAVDASGNRRELLTRSLDLPAGDVATFRVTHAADPALAFRYEAALSPADRFAQNDTAATMILPRRRRIAIVARETQALHAALAKTDMPPTESLAPNTLTPANRWSDFSAVVLVDASGTALAPADRASLAAYVRAGGGLVLLGAGPHHSPADRADPLNRVAALRANPYQRRPLKLSAVIDASGSMAEPAAGSSAGRTKFDLAAEAVLSLKRHLTVADALAVITFSDFPQTVYDSGDRAPDFSKLRDALAAVRPAGPTRLGEALAKIADAGPDDKRDSLVFLVSDLQTEPFDVQATARRFRDRDLSLTIVAIRSPQANGVQRNLAGQMTAAFDATLIEGVDLRRLAGVFGELLRESRGDAIRRGQFTATVDRPPFALSLRWPKLEAYILSAAAETAEVLLSVDGDPLVARRRAGLGRTVSLALPIERGDNAAWRGSNDFAALLSAAIRWSARGGGDERFSVRIRRQASRTRVIVEAADRGMPMGGLQLVAEYLAGDMETPVSTNPLVQIAPGRYELRLEHPDLAEPIALIVRDASTGRAVWRGTIGSSYPPEFTATGANWEKLRRLATHCGGRIVATDRLLSVAASRSMEMSMSLWPIALSIALASMLAEWLASRRSRRRLIGRGDG